MRQLTRLVIFVIVIGRAEDAVRADSFDRYLNPVISKAAGQDGVVNLKQLTPEQIADHDRVLSDADAALVVVHTNGARYSKLLVRSAFRKIDADKRMPMLLIERFVTYKEGEERTIVASGGNIQLFPEFRFSLDLGQVVPAEMGGDIQFKVDKDKAFTEPLGKANLYLLTKPLPEAAKAKSNKIQIGETFESRYFNGVYDLKDDGRRSGKLTLKVQDSGDVTGEYFSDKDGNKYEVRGKINSPNHQIQFTIKFPKSEQVFTGWLFTGDGKALCGSSRLGDRDAGFYATRVEE